MKTPNPLLINDGRGNMIPDHPGEIVPITELPDDHPARVFLDNRDCDFISMYDQFRVSFCTKEAPANPAKGRIYREVCDDFLDTPQNRIIFYADVNGVQHGWIARVIDRVDGNMKFYLHPYKNKWVLGKCRKDNNWVDAPFRYGETKFDVSEYLTEFGLLNQTLLFGLGGALAWNEEMRPGEPRVAYVAETPFEAHRFGRFGIATLKKDFSQPQFEILSFRFDILIYAGQNTARSRQFGKAMKTACAGKVVFEEIYPPSGFATFDEMTLCEADRFTRPVFMKYIWP